MRAARLSRTYDPDLLVRDLEALRSLPQAPQPGPYHDGDWTGLTLYAPGGGDPALAHPQLHPYAPTPALRHAPYLAEVLSGLDCPKLLVRLLTLPPDAEIGEHNDAGSTFLYGSLRLHVPIVTHPDVIMEIGGERVAWRPGELWWGDFSQRHWLRNDSPVTRVHLVIDVQVTDALLALFPPELVAEKEAAGQVSRYLPPVPGTEEELAALAGMFRLPARVAPLFAPDDSLQQVARDLTVDCAPVDGRLVASVDGTPAFALERTGPGRFSVVGQPAGMSVEFHAEGGRRTVELVIRGVPEDLYAARLGFQRGPVIPEQRITMAVLHSCGSRNPV